MMEAAFVTLAIKREEFEDWGGTQWLKAGKVTIRRWLTSSISQGRRMTAIMRGHIPTPK